MARTKTKATVPPEKASGKTRGKIKREENKQLDVKSSGAQREEVKVARKSAKVGAATVRQCAVTRERLPESELLRFVLDGQGRVTPDLKRRLPGRGVWVTANRGVLTEAVRRRALLRGLKAEDELRDQVRPSRGGEAGDAPGAVTETPAEDISADEPKDLPVVVEALLRRSALSALSLANKAGQVTLGFEAVARALASRGVIGLIHAADAAEDGRRKLDRMFARDAGGGTHAGAGEDAADRRPDGGPACEQILDDPLGAGREENGRPIVGIFSCEELSSALGRTNAMHAALKKGGASANFLKEAHRLSRYLEPAPAKPSKRRLKQDKV